MDLAVRNSFCPQTCKVFGDPATGHHYRSPACNGCKNFYRRAILGMKVFKPCPLEGICMKEGYTSLLKRCRQCRLQRCTEGGMNPLCVVGPVPHDENPLVQYILDQMKQLRCTYEPSTSGQAKLTLEVAPKSPEILMNRLIDELAFLEKAHEKIRRSRYAPLPEDGIPLAEMLKGHSKLSIDYGDMIICTSAQPADQTCEDPFSDMEICLKKRSLCLIKFLKVWPHADLYLKTFEVFHRLSETEQLHLVRWVVIVCAHLTLSYFSYKMKSEVTYHPDGSSFRITCATHHTCRKFQASPPCDSKHKREYHIESVERIRNLEMDEQEYVLLKAIIVCDPTIDGLNDYGRKILDEQRTRFTKTLFSYMSASRETNKAPERLLEMLKLIDWLRGVNERRKEYHLLRAVGGLRPWYCSEEADDKPVLQDELFL